MKEFATDSGPLDARTMARKAKRARSANPAVTDHAAVAEIVDLVEVGRRHVARTINATMTAVYWAIGRRIVLEVEQGRVERAVGDQDVCVPGELAELATDCRGFPFAIRCEARTVSP